ncbi:MAG TPA: hypothetical protein VKB88_26905 [Bryobacteraceae bacterium]|nr:hypothetical protein [Bryobacteraceae bacterium]
MVEGEFKHPVRAKAIRFSHGDFGLGQPLPEPAGNQFLRSEIVEDQLSIGGEEHLKGLDRSLFADPKQTGDAEIDLINQCQVLAPFGVLISSTPMASI